MKLRNLDFNMQENDTKSSSLILHRTQLQMDHGPQHKTQYLKKKSKNNIEDMLKLRFMGEDF